MPRIKALTLQQAVSLIEELSEDELESVDIAVIPPENKNDSDLEEDDDEVGVLQEVQDIAGTLEVAIDENDASEEFDSSHEDAETSTTTWKTAVNPKWRRRLGQYTKIASDGWSHEQKKFAMKEELMDSSPIQLFEKMFDSRCIDLLVAETNRYAAQKNESNFQVRPEEIKAFIGILFCLDIINYHLRSFIGL